MMRGLLTLFVFISVVFFPWPLTAALAFFSSLYIPLLPLAAGVFADTLYYTSSTNALVLGTPHAATLPLFSLYGAIVTGIALFVRSQMKTNPVRDLWHLG